MFKIALVFFRLIKTECCCDASLKHVSQQWYHGFLNFKQVLLAM